MTLEEQSWSFLISIITGAGAAFLYDFYSAVRISTRMRRWGTAIGDIVFWLALIPFVFVVLLLTNWGEVRWYVIFGLAIGAAVYRRLVSRQVVSFWISLLGISARASRFASRPVAFTFRLAARPVQRTAARLKRPRRSAPGPDSGEHS